MSISKIMSLTLKNGLRKYKFKNSKVRPFYTKSEGNKGAVFGFRSKEKMIASRGIVLTSEEALSENENCLSHWTPNVYSYGTYADSSRTIVKGHAEHNLKQINTFVVDIDLPGKKFNHGEIVLAALDNIGYMPTLILDTARGYQVYFVLSSPAYVTKKSNFKVVDVAKKISMNIRKELSKTLSGIDIMCNHFGIARIPRKDNVLFFEESYTYSFKDWLNWSMTVSEDKKAEVVQFPKLKNEVRQIDEKWVDLLLNTEKLKGSKGVIGRNNAFFTLSLAYYSSRCDIKTCEYNLIMLNERLKNALKESEIKRIIKSAYSSKYEAASKSYIRELCHTWINSDLTDDQLFSSNRGWYKFKKDRKDRVRSHLIEWEMDIMKYLSNQSYTNKPFIYSTKKGIREGIGVPERSFDVALKRLKEKNQIFFRVKSGRGGGIMIASVKALMQTIIVTKKEVREAYFEAIREAFLIPSTLIQKVFYQLLPVEKEYIQPTIVGWGDG